MRTSGLSDTQPIPVPHAPETRVPEARVPEARAGESASRRSGRPPVRGTGQHPSQRGAQRGDINRSGTRTNRSGNAQPHHRSTDAREMPTSNPDAPQPPRAPHNPAGAAAVANRKRHRPRRKRRVGCCLGQSIFLTILLLFGLYSAVALYGIGKMEQEETGPRTLTSNAVYQDDDVRNILLIGSDTRGSDRGRSDSMILLSISKHNHTITMTSIMRDSYVSIPGHGCNKLNAAFSYGGATLLMDTIENNFSIAIDDYICISFQSFVYVTDALGGVEITVSDAEATAINNILHDEVNGLMGDAQTADYLPCGGTYLLNGKQALSYSRIRYVGNADFERTERQRTVLNGLVGSAKRLTPSKLSNLCKNALPHLSTNLETGTLYWLSLQLPYLMLRYEMQTLRMPADGTYSNQTTDSGAMVLAVDFDANRKLFEQAVQNPVVKPESTTTRPAA